MKYLGIDYGEKRVGVAVSDELEKMAFPLVVLQNSPNIVLEIDKICKDKSITDIVIGESKNYAQDDNKIMEEIRPFVATLKSYTGLPVHYHPEFMSSQQAERFQGKNDLHDASAAAIILTSFLEKQK